MAMQIVNPNWKSETEKKAVLHAPAVSAWMAENSNNKLIGIGELRSAMPGIAADLSRAVINHICFILKIEVIGSEDGAL